jgi:O-antigen/teichoic acid export membrane protein
MALQLSVIPTDKIVSLINRVSFPLFSRCQNEPEIFNNFFLKMVKILSIIALPLYCGGVFIADELILALLGPKWMDTIVPFKMLCVAQIFVALASANAIVYNARGLPRVNLYFNLVNVIMLPLSFFVAARYGLVYIAVPWITIHPLLRIGQTWMTLRMLSLRISSYLKAISHPICAVVSMMVILMIFRSFYFAVIDPQRSMAVAYITTAVSLGAASYVGYYFLFQRNVIWVLWALVNSRGRSMDREDERQGD